MKLLRRALLALFLGSVLFGLAAGAWYAHQGYRVYAVRTGSMMPALMPGDAVIDAPVSGDLSVGDVITFRPTATATEVITHRVNRRSDTTVQTKGDANRTPDVARVPNANVVGRVIRSIPHGGYVLYFFSRRAGIGALVAGLIALSLLWGLFFPASKDGVSLLETRFSAAPSGSS